MATERISRERAGWTDGKRRPCRWCGAEPPPGRRTFCSDACVHEHKLRTSTAYQASHVLERDHGVCERCGRDCVAELVRLHNAKREIAVSIARVRGTPYTCHSVYPYAHGLCGHDDCMSASVSRYSAEFVAAWSEHCDGLGLPRHLRDGSRRLWEMDHRVPVVEGGGDCGLENLRTLCWSCHHEATAELAARRAEQRRTEKRGTP